MINTIKLVILVMACWSVCISIYSHNLPDGVAEYVAGFRQTEHSKSLDEINQDIQGSMEQQTSVPLIEMGALIFYSGNLFIDMALNFVYAIPEMITMVIYGLMRLLNIDTALLFAIQTLLSVLITIMYFLGFIEFILALRGGSSKLV